MININNIPLGSRARIEVELTVPTEVSTKAILHLVHNTSPSWNGEFSASLTESESTGDFSVNKEATITTYHDTLSEISFKSKLFDGSSTATQDVPLTRQDLVPTDAGDWVGDEWTKENNYGVWIVGTKNSCADGANCFNVRFEPNETNIDEIADKTVRLELETVITGSAPETKALTYTIVGDSLELALNQGSSSEIVVRTDNATIPDISGTATAFKEENDTFSVAVTETIPGQNPTPGNEPTEVDTTTLGYDSKQYGSNFSLGSWYFAEDDTNETADPANSNFHTVSRNFVFKPNSANINALQSGDTRTLTLTIKTMRGTDTINTETLTITIRKSTKPNFTITAVTGTINEGGTATFEVSSDLDPGSSQIDLNYIAFEKDFDTTAKYLPDGVHNVSQPLPLNFTNPPGGDNVWTDTFTVAMKTADDNDTKPGEITVTLQPVAANLAYTVATAPNNSAKVTVNDLTTPEITIADAPRTIAGTAAEFTLMTRTKPWQPLGIRYIPTETGTSFLNPSRGDPGDMITIDPKITFSPSPDNAQIFVGTLSIPTRVDPDGNTSGTISIQLLDDAEDNPDKTTESLVINYPIRKQ